MAWKRHSGRLLSYNAQRSAQTGVFNISPNIDRRAPTVVRAAFGWRGGLCGTAREVNLHRQGPWNRRKDSYAVQY